MLEQKIDHGVTVGDVINYGEVNRSTEGVLAFDSFEKFGPITPELAQEVAERFDVLKQIVDSALQADKLDPGKYLPDLDNNPYNVVLERLKTPEAGSFIKYWIIDQ